MLLLPKRCAAVAPFRGLTQLLHAELHWLHVADRVTYKLGWMVYKCLHGQAPDYLSELCMPVAQVANASISVHPAAACSSPQGSSCSSCLCRGCASNLELTVGRTAKCGMRISTVPPSDATYLKKFLFQQYLVH